MSFISIVIPLYNEESNIYELLTRLRQSTSGWSDKYELLLVNDGSTDGTATIINDHIYEFENIKLINLSRNFGHQAAIMAGIQLAIGDSIILMDGDLQDPPEELEKFINKWKQGYDVVYAIRKNRKENLIKQISYFLFYRIYRFLSNIEVPLDSGDFCILDRKVVEVIKTQMPESRKFLRGLRSYAGFKQIGLEYERQSRHSGLPKYSTKKLIQLALDGLLDFSVLPLRVSTIIGVLISFSSFAIGTLFALYKIFNFDLFGYHPDATPGVITILVSFFFLFGLVLFVLGIVGEYLGRIYIEVKKRPFYIISEIKSNEQN